MSESPSQQLLETIRHALHVQGIRPLERVQSLWSGYGAIWRLEVASAISKVELGPPVPIEECSIIVKHVHPPSAQYHPRGWSSDFSHERKLESYRVERCWYEKFALMCDSDCRVPRAFWLQEHEGSWIFVLEDLDAQGFSERLTTLSEERMKDCLSWLAHFHARFLRVNSKGLWPIGSYWHLATRPDEFEVMGDQVLKNAAGAIDLKLNRARYQTLIHGDAKVANFCFRPLNHLPPKQGELNLTNVAAVDFQYVGTSVGVKDVAYFLSSCLNERECELYGEKWLNFYFKVLIERVSELAPSINGGELEEEWRALYAFAWADFVRFLNGWAPEHYKVHGYSERMTQAALASLGG